MQYDGRSELLKAAPKRLDDAWELLEAPTRNPERSDADYRHLCAAYYLAGYAVECVLKAYVILLLDGRGSERIARWSQVIAHVEAAGGGPDLTGRHSHRLNRLLIVSELEAQLGSDLQARHDWGICGTWDYAARYMPEHMRDREGIERFVAACDHLFHWVERRLPGR